MLNSALCSHVLCSLKGWKAFQIRPWICQPLRVWKCSVYGDVGCKYVADIRDWCSVTGALARKPRMQNCGVCQVRHGNAFGEKEQVKENGSLMPWKARVNSELYVMYVLIA